MISDWAGWLQEAISSKMGGTAFNTVVDGQRTLQSGDALRLTTKPVLVGRALYFVVGQVSGVSIACFFPSQFCLLPSAAEWIGWCLTSHLPYPDIGSFQMLQTSALGAANPYPIRSRVVATYL